MTASVALALLVGGCATTPRPAQTSDKSSKTESSKSDASGKAIGGMVVTPKGGGYYDNDGPPTMVPADLAAIADAVPRHELIKAGSNRPYSVFGQRYEPMTRRTAFTQNGVASWYGKQFHGRKTSNGEIYDMLGMTAAHPTLPIPSYVRVTNVKNGRQVVVRVNDRGPFLQNRAIDLSYAAATKLGYTESGHTQVTIELLLPESGPADNSSPAANPIVIATAKPLVQVASAVTPPVKLQPVALAPAKADPSFDPLSDSLPDPLAALVAQQTKAESASINRSAAMRGTAELSSVNRSTAALAHSSGQISMTAVFDPSSSVGASPVPSASSMASIFLQLGAFTSRDNAEASLYKVARLFPESEGLLNLDQSDRVIRLRFGPLTVEQASRQADRIELVTGFRPIRTMSK